MVGSYITKDEIQHEIAIVYSIGYDITWDSKYYTESRMAWN